MLAFWRDFIENIQKNSVISEILELSDPSVFFSHGSLDPHCKLSFSQSKHYILIRKKKYHIQESVVFWCLVLQKSILKALYFPLFGYNFPFSDMHKMIFKLQAYAW